MDLLELFPVDFDLTPLARLRLREAAGGELAVVPLESLTLKQRRRFSEVLGQALIDERSAMRLEALLPDCRRWQFPRWQHGNYAIVCDGA